jgi:hypothetical protein
MNATIQVTPLDLAVERTLNELLKAEKAGLDAMRDLLRRILQGPTETVDEDGEPVPF